MVLAMLCLKSELDWASLTYYLCSQSLTHVISVCAMTFRCCARNSAFSRIQVVWVRNLNRPIRHVLAQPGVRKVEAGAPWAAGVRHPSLEFQWGLQRDKG